MSLLIVSVGEEFFDLVVLRKKYSVLRWLSDFELKNGSRQFNEKCFSIKSWTYYTELRTGGGVYPC